MKFTEYLVFAALMIPTAALLTAAVISLAADNAAPDAQLYNSSVVAAYGRSALRRNSPRAGPRTGASVGRRFRDRKFGCLATRDSLRGNRRLRSGQARQQAESHAIRLSPTRGLPDQAIGVIPMAVGFPPERVSGGNEFLQMYGNTAYRISGQLRELKW